MQYRTFTHPTGFVGSSVKKSKTDMHRFLFEEAALVAKYQKDTEREKAKRKFRKLTRQAQRNGTTLEDFLRFRATERLWQKWKDRAAEHTLVSHYSKADGVTYVLRTETAKAVYERWEAPRTVTFTVVGYAHVYGHYDRTKPLSIPLGSTIMASGLQALKKFHLEHEGPWFTTMKGTVDYLLETFDEHYPPHLYFMARRRGEALAHLEQLRVQLSTEAP
jgi:hypothetical protein